jgi:delta 1-pyrroline-5-carboxylate dehydrogenase
VVHGERCDDEVEGALGQRVLETVHAQMASATSAEEDAVHRANATEFGLAAGVFTRDVDRARRVGRQITAGNPRRSYR